MWSSCRLFLPFCIMLFTIQGTSRAQLAPFINKFENPSLSLKKRLVVSLKQAMRSEHNNRVWIGYGIRIHSHYPDSFPGGSPHNALPTLDELLNTQAMVLHTRLKPAQASAVLFPELTRQQRLKLQRGQEEQIGILLDFSLESGRPILLRTITIRFSDPVRLGYQELYWLGFVDHNESYHLLTDCFKEYRYVRLRCSILAALNIHSNTDRTLPYFKKVLYGKFNQKIIESCIYLLGENSTLKSEYILSTFLMKTKDKSLKRKAILALNSAKSNSAYKAVKYILDHEHDRNIRKDALLCLGMMGHEKSLPLLTNTLINDSDKALREFAVFVMGQITHPKAETILTQIGLTHPDLTIRQKALSWIQRQKSQRVRHAYPDLTDESD